MVRQIHSVGRSRRFRGRRRRLDLARRHRLRPSVRRRACLAPRPGAQDRRSRFRGPRRGRRHARRRMGCRPLRPLLQRARPPRPSPGRACAAAGCGAPADAGDRPGLARAGAASCRRSDGHAAGGAGRPVRPRDRGSAGPGAGRSSGADLARRSGKPDARANRIPRAGRTQRGYRRGAAQPRKRSCGRPRSRIARRAATRPRPPSFGRRG